MGKVVISELKESLSRKTTCDLCDDYNDHLIYPDVVSLKNIGGANKFSGFVYIVRCYQDNSVVRSVLTDQNIAKITPKVLIVDGAGSRKFALLGDKMAQLSLDNNWSGIVVNGCIRDCVALKQMKIGVLALGTNPQKTKKLGNGAQLDKTHIFGVNVQKGDFLVADEDGIVLFPRELLQNSSSL